MKGLISFTVLGDTFSNIMIKRHSGQKILSSEMLGNKAGEQYQKTKNERPDIDSKAKLPRPVKLTQSILIITHGNNRVGPLHDSSYMKSNCIL